MKKFTLILSGIIVVALVLSLNNSNQKQEYKRIKSTAQYDLDTSENQKNIGEKIQWKR